MFSEDEYGLVIVVFMYTYVCMCVSVLVQRQEDLCRGKKTQS